MDRSPYYQIKTPVCRIRMAARSVMARQYGDEYEGEIALGRLIRAWTRARRDHDPPMANVPAVMAARRRSPLDNGNLNAFPGGTSRAAGAFPGA